MKNTILKSPNKTLVIDCSDLCYGSAYAMLGMEWEEVETGVLFGFLRELKTLSKKFHGIDFVFCWDSKSSFRKDVFPEYKIKRAKKKKEDAELAKIFASTFEQIKKLRYEILPGMEFVNSFSQEGLEADDLMAEIVLSYEDCVIVSGDEDMLQMLEYCSIWNRKKKKMWNEKVFIAEKNISPSEWNLVKAIAGCKSDEVPGIPGVGESTAIKYITKELPVNYKSYGNIKSSWNKIVHRNLPLVTLPHDRTEPIELDMQKPLNSEYFWEMCGKYRFESFMKGSELESWNLFLEGRL